MPTWTFDKVNSLKSSAVKTRLLHELKSERGSPVTGSLQYWEQIIKSKSTNFRKHPEEYRLGKGEQGVLSTPPYTHEISPYWRFKTEEEAFLSADAIYFLFQTYLSEEDFVGADIALKFLQMGFTRARRYANHPSGRKYDRNGQKLAQSPDALISEKARAADVFKMYWDEGKLDASYLKLRLNFKTKGSRHE